MMRSLNIAGVIVGVGMVIVALPSSGGGMALLAGGLTLTGVNIYALLARRKVKRKGNSHVE